jgi:hypothetical protein
LIGVIPRADQIEAVEEFFELFKTPWEMYRPGIVYDVIVATADIPLDLSARLLLVYGSDEKGIDSALKIGRGSRRENGILGYRDIKVPVYGDLLAFTAVSGHVEYATASSEAAAVRVRADGATVIRIGYDLFDQVRMLLSAGQPAEYAPVPTLDIHIEMLREWMAGAGIGFIEIPPCPAGHSFAVCLTHDVDFVGIRRHKFDHTMWGFVYRATIGAIRKCARGRFTLGQVVRSWTAAASLPFVYAGWAKDFWEPFEWYLKVEDGLPATYFLIPFKRRSGDRVPGRFASRRAAAYDASDLPEWTKVLQARGCEIGTHGIDAWHSVERGRAELAAVASVAKQPCGGIRVHWLLRDRNTPSVLERAGYIYDSTCGYNQTVGYRAGTSQVFRPAGTRTLIELPLHIQDGALFYSQHLNLPEREADKRCGALVDFASRLGGVLTVLWHDRSHAAERFWGDFYIRLVARLKSLDCWFGSAAQVVAWFRKRREVRFEQDGGRIRIEYNGDPIDPPLRVRVHSASCPDTERTEPEFTDITWRGERTAAIESKLQVNYP